MPMVVIHGDSAMNDLRQGKANERGGAIDDDGWEPEANSTTTVEICEYALNQ